LTGERRIKVALVLEATQGGTLRHLLDILHGLSAERFDLLPVVSPRADGEILSELNRLWTAGRRAEVVPMRRNPSPLHDAIALFRLWRLFRREPATIRFLDPPLHEFLPHDHAAQNKLAEKLGVSVDKICQRVKELHEFNPMLGFRGCRLGIVYPEISEMQARAVFEGEEGIIRGVVLQVARLRKTKHKIPDYMRMRPGLWERTGEEIFLREYPLKGPLGDLVKVYGVEKDLLKEMRSFVVGTELTAEQYQRMR